MGSAAASCKQSGRARTSAGTFGECADDDERRDRAFGAIGTVRDGGRAMILVTGATGFIGGAVCAGLSAAGRDFAGIGRSRMLRSAFGEATAGSFAWTRRNLAGLLSDLRPDAIIHLAGAAAPSAADRAEDHVAALEDVLGACREADCRPRLILGSSAAVYGTRTTPEFLGESAATRPQAPYGRAKLACEARLRHAMEAEGFPGTAMRIFNAIGPGQRSGLLVDILDQVDLREARGAPMRLTLRSLSSHRDFIDVRDVARCLVAAAASDDMPGIINICSGRGVSVREVVEHVGAVLGRPVHVHVPRPDSDADYSIGRPGAWLDGLASPIPLERSIADAIEERREGPG